MTKQKELKKKIRARMKKTGERYSAARAQVLSEAKESTLVLPAGVVPGYVRFGGLQDETGVLANVFAHAGLRSPVRDAPYSEAELHGLCGGVGFLHAVFEYKGFPPLLTLVPRSRSMPQTYISSVFSRVGASTNTNRSSSDAAAKRTLDEALDEGAPVICLLDAACLPHSSFPRIMAGACPHYVAVVGRDQGAYLIDDRALVPIRIPSETMVVARSAYRAGKRESIMVLGVDDVHDWRAQWRSALVDTVNGMREGDPTVPKSFRSNTGLAGLEKWQALLTASHKKAWPRVFDQGGNALAGLRRAYDGICYEYTAPAAGRPLYAEFLDLAAEALRLPDLSRAAVGFRTAGEAWQAMADLISSIPNAAVRRSCELADTRAQALDDGVEVASYNELRELAEQRRALGKNCDLDASLARETYVKLAGHLGDVIALEREAVEMMSSAVG